MLLYYHSWMFYNHFIVILYHFLVLSYWHSVQCQLLFFACFLHRRKSIPNGVQMQRNFLWIFSRPEDTRWTKEHYKKNTRPWWYVFVTVGHVFCHACTSMTILWQNQDSHTCAVVEVFHDITKIIITEVSTSMTISGVS